MRSEHSKQPTAVRMWTYVFIQTRASQQSVPIMLVDVQYGVYCTVKYVRVNAYMRRTAAAEVAQWQYV